jgi:hypothetical protein
LKVNGTGMTSDLPIACSLSAGDLNDRLAEIADLGRDALLEADLVGFRADLRFARAPGIAQRLARIVVAESECCAFLTISVREDDDGLVLTIVAPEGAELVLEELVTGFRRDRVVAR